MEYKVYGLRVAGTTQVRYIGITKQSLRQRLKRHRSETKRNPHKIAWFKKHGNNIEINLIEAGITDLKTANRKEQGYIKHFKALGCDLINKTFGGDGTQGFEPWNKGRSCAYIDKLIENSPRSKPVYSYDLSGNFIEGFRSVKQASLTLNVQRGNIVNIAKLKTGYKQAKGYQFRFFRSASIPPVQYDESERLNKVRTAKQRSRRRVCIIENGQNLVFDNALKAGIHLGIKQESVLAYCSNQSIKNGKKFIYA